MSSATGRGGYLMIEILPFDDINGEPLGRRVQQKVGEGDSRRQVAARSRYGTRQRRGSGAGGSTSTS